MLNVSSMARVTSPQRQRVLDHTSEVQDWVAEFVRFLAVESDDRVGASHDPSRSLTQQARDAARAAGASLLGYLISSTVESVRHLPVVSRLLRLSTVVRGAIQEADPTDPGQAALSIYAIRFIHVVDDWRVYLASVSGDHRALDVDFPDDPDEV